MSRDSSRSSSSPPSSALERLMKIASGLFDMSEAVCFAVDGEQAFLVAHVGDSRAGPPVERIVSSKRLRLDAPRWTLHAGRGANAPELGLFSLGFVPLAAVTLPLVREGVQIGTLIVADDRPIAEPGKRKRAALDELSGLIVDALHLHVDGPDEAKRSARRDAARARSSAPSSRVDPVTQLPDRVSLHQETERRLERAATLTHGLALVLVSIDRFRRVNDSLGHAIGDALLRQVAARLVSSVSDCDLVGRRSGDEFIVILDELNTRRPPLPIVDRIQQALREPFFVEGNEIVLTACLGMARTPDDTSELASLLRFADIALHRAKMEGQGRVKLFDASMQQAARERLDIEHQLREAMRVGQLVVHYQPKYSIAKRTLVGAEALLRWKHPHKGVISPTRFIPVAEESGLIVPIGTWALTEVAMQCAAWRNAGLDVGRVSVNVSGLQFTRHDFVGTVKRALHASGIPASMLELELTETVVMHDVESAIARLHELRRLGVRVSVDDFGTGYSSLAYLQKLPIDVLKIDRSFVRDLDSEAQLAEQARSLTQTITVLGHQLGLTVLAEGVETKAQLEALKSLGCDEAQGFLLGRPMSADVFRTHIEDAGNARERASAPPPGV